MFVLLETVINCSIECIANINFSNPIVNIINGLFISCCSIGKFNVHNNYVCMTFIVQACLYIRFSGPAIFVHSREVSALWRLKLEINVQLVPSLCLYVRVWSLATISGFTVYIYMYVYMLLINS